MTLKDEGYPGDPSPGQSCGLIQQYEAIAQASRSMLEAAHLGNWDRVEQIEARCREMIAALKQASAKNSLGAAEQRRRIALLRSILNDDAQIRARAEPWLRDLEELLRATPRASSRTP